jgi:hypothetical protein
VNSHRASSKEVSMKHSNRFGVITAAATAMTLVALVLPHEAEARGRRGRSFAVHRGVFANPHFWLGYGFGPYAGAYYGPHGYRPEGGIDMGAAMLAGFGAIDLDVKPGRAEVWVDGRYVAEARDLDGYPSFLWLAEGVHRVTIYNGGYVTFDESIDVHRGIEKDLKVRLEKGESVPPEPRQDGSGPPRR